MAIENTASTVSRRGFVAGTAAAAGIAAASGALTGSEALAVTNATSGGNTPAWLGEEPAVDDIAGTLECDVLIVGAGNGGMVAAATASDLGVDFLLCESCDTPEDTRHWIGAINSKHTEETGTQVDVKREQYELARYASFKCNQRLQKMWIDESAELIDWLDTIMEPAGFACSVDAEMGYEMDPAHETGFYVPPQQHMYNATTDGVSTWEHGRNLVLLDYIAEAGNGDKILWNHELVKLVHDDGKVTGAIFDTPEGAVQVNANHVILATGGYASNPEMMKALAPMTLEACTAVSYSPKTRGQGIKAALWAGAKMDTEPAPMIFNRGLVDNGVACGYDENDMLRGTVGQFGVGSQPFMKVAKDGRRFANESSPYDFICFAAALHQDGNWAMIFDANAGEDATRFATVGCSKGAGGLIRNHNVDEVFARQIENGLVKRADTIEELADALGFEGAAKEAFLAEVERYNGFYDAQDDEDFGKEAYRLSAVREAPFYGAWFGGSLLTTCDGLRIDEECRVLDRDAQPIEGLYAVGDCSGSFFSGNYPEYLIGVACGRTLTEGRHVIRKIAGDL